jgi:sterol desaturase/sphingolipid hydroxylase (fatty acid hydroxylase superfamily)
MASFSFAHYNWQASLAVALAVVAILPFSATVDSPSFARILLEIVAILMVYDFFYYMAHRFLMHGNGPLRRIHGIHHQARDPSWIDSHYVHPIEIAVGLWLFFGTVAGYALIVGGRRTSSRSWSASSPSTKSISSTTPTSNCRTSPSRR